MAKYLVVVLLVLALVPVHVAHAAPAAAGPGPCEEDWVDREVRGWATEGADEVYIACRLSLRSTDTISKRLVFVGKGAWGVRVDCHGALLDPRGTVNEDRVMLSIVADHTGDSTWDTPTNISITGCTVFGSIAIYTDGNISELSHHRDYPQKMRGIAPKYITLDGLDIVGTGQTNLVYLYEGVTHVTLINSHLSGHISGVPLYLDAESGFNTIRANRIEVDSDTREQIAVDGSSHNLIVDNYFSGLDTGGIYLYRNCGEKGTVRHTPPSYNQIINNYFYYDRYTEDHYPYRALNPAVYVGSRYVHKDENTKNCNADDGYPFGSGTDDRDLAHGNVVAQNQIRKRDPKDAIRSKDWRINSPNYVAFNDRVDARIYRKAGCSVIDGTTWRFLLHGRSTQLPDVGKTAASYRCNDGVLVPENTIADRGSGLIRLPLAESASSRLRRDRSAAADRRRSAAPEKESGGRPAAATWTPSPSADRPLSC